MLCLSRFFILSFVNRTSFSSSSSLPHSPICSTQTLLNIAHCMGSILDESWYIVLETLEQLHIFLSFNKKVPLCVIESFVFVGLLLLLLLLLLWLRIEWCVETKHFIVSYCLICSSSSRHCRQARHSCQERTHPMKCSLV
jgi:hypothetical protein